MKKTVNLMGIILAVALCVSVLFGASALAADSTPDASNDPTVLLTFGGTAAAEDMITKGMERIAEEVNKRSGGTIIIKTFPSSQLGDAVAQLESVVMGGQDMLVEAQGSYMQQYGIADAAVNSFGLVGTQEALGKELKSDMWKSLEEQFKEKTGVVTLANNWIRQQTVIASKTPLETVDDFTGVKLRVVPSATTTAVYAALGFSPTPVAYSEVYLSLSQGVIDATISTFDATYTMAFYEVAPYITKYGNSCTNVAVWINGAKFASMTEAQQQILREVCEETGDWYFEQSNAVMASYVEKMEENGATVIDVDDDFRATCNDKLKDLAYEFEANGKWSVGLYDTLAEIVR